MWYRVSSHSNWKSSNNVSILHTEHIAILGVLSASKLNQGWYTCRVSNGRNQFCKSVKISIVSPPQVTIEPLSVTTRKVFHKWCYISHSFNSVIPYQIFWWLAQFFLNFNTNSFFIQHCRFLQLRCLQVTFLLSWYTAL